MPEVVDVGRREAADAIYVVRRFVRKHSHQFAIVGRREPYADQGIVLAKQRVLARVIDLCGFKEVADLSDYGPMARLEQPEKDEVERLSKLGVDGWVPVIGGRGIGWIFKGGHARREVYI
jgi:hypothetical protein